MNNRKTTFSGENYGKKIAIEIDHSDITISEVFEAFETIALGLGFHPQTWKGAIIEMAEEYKDEIKEESSENEDNDWYEENKTNQVISILKEMEVDGETTQYILERIGMGEQMAIQLATKYPDVVSEHLAEIKSEQELKDNEK